MNVAQVSALQKETVNNVAAVSELYRLVGSEPVSCVGAERDTLSANRGVADDIALVGIAIQVASVPVEKTAARRLNQTREIGEGRLGAKIQVRQSGNVGEINSRIVRRTPRITDRRCLILDERILIHSNPIPQFRDAITEVEGGAAV